MLRVFCLDDLNSKQFNFKRKELSRELVDVAFGAGRDLFVLSRVLR